VIGDFIYTEKEPLRDDIIGLMKEKPSLKERKSIAERVKDKILGLVETLLMGFRRRLRWVGILNFCLRTF